MITINPYLNFAGNTEEAFNFYKSVFGGEFTLVIRYKDMGETCDSTPTDENKIMHIALPIGQGNMLMATDMIGEMAKTLTRGNSDSISINGGTVEESGNLFKALSQGGKVLVPFDKSSWGSYFGMLSDQFGVQWMMDCPIEQ
ncbi:VOC family protein [Mucilaginibacter aquaedulcis]|uniref:VOC family protein n=1 Tax=Mucilaginibacter aquaedulcis TaxID=1187081 RepID=UPI0025B4C95E|nr:VOC family protein [Mucilaginibacter aquaedulcis]MDN3548259.1 VOC family protein [Mucilaginibacter aquaedulcis]